MSKIIKEADPILNLDPYPIWALWDFYTRPLFTLYDYLGFNRKLQIYCFQRRNQPKAPIWGRSAYQMQESFIIGDFKPFLINFDEIYPDPPKPPPLPKGPITDAAS